MHDYDVQQALYRYKEIHWSWATDYDPRWDQVS